MNTVFTTYHEQTIQELDAEYMMWAEKTCKLEEECEHLRNDLEKVRLGYMTVLAKLEHQEGVIAQLQLELESYRKIAQSCVKNGQSGQVDSGQMSSGQINAPAVEARAIGGQVVESAHPKTYSRQVKGDVIRQHAQTYPGKTHAEIATHFQVSTKTVQRALKARKNSQVGGIGQ
jgi:hypothetical protein